MFIPLDLNLPLLVGGAVAWYVSTRSKDEKINNERKEKGTLLASGFIAGGALMGVVSAIMKFSGINWYQKLWSGTNYAQYVGIVVYMLLICYLIFASLKKEKSNC